MDRSTHSATHTGFSRRPPTYSVHRIRVGRFGFTNFCYLIVDHATRVAAAVDPAWNLAPILQTLEASNAELRVILLTHTHFDHVNLVNALYKRFAPKIHVGRVEADYYGFRGPGLHWLDDLDEIRIGQTRAQALLTPGHTAGSLCYRLEHDLFSGDTLFTEGCGSCDCAGGSPQQMFQTLQRLRQQIPHSTQVHPGHSFGKEPGQTLAELLKNNVYFHFDKLQDFVAFRMRPNQRAPFDFR